LDGAEFKEKDTMAKLRDALGLPVRNFITFIGDTHPKKSLYVVRYGLKSAIKHQVSCVFWHFPGDNGRNLKVLFGRDLIGCKTCENKMS